MLEHPGFPRTVLQRDSVDYACLVGVIVAVCCGDIPVGSGAVLVFLPGVMEIRKVHRMVDAAVEDGRMPGACVEVLELHGSLTPAEQVWKWRAHGAERVALR